MQLIYLDHASTTPLHPEVKKEMLPFLEGSFGNPSSIHRAGRESRAAIDEARVRIASVLHADPSDIIFTSGGTEANNAALFGVLNRSLSEGKNHLITSQIEHHAVLHTCKFLERRGYKVTYLPVDHLGRIDSDECRRAITPHTALISIMYGNNEVGTLQPVYEIGEIAKSHDVYFHTDAIQAFGVEDLHVNAMQADLVSLSSHKINGPKGVGALYVRRDVRMTPFLFGGTQERNLRAGTENVLGIVGFGKAASLVRKNKKAYKEKLLSLKSAFVHELDKCEIQYVINGNIDACLPHILNVSFRGCESEVLLMNLDMEGIACSAAATCSTGIVGSSHVLLAMGLSEKRRQSAIRFSFGYGNTEEEMTAVSRKIKKIIDRLKNL